MLFGEIRAVIALSRIEDDQLDNFMNFLIENMPRCG